MDIFETKSTVVARGVRAVSVVAKESIAVAEVVVVIDHELELNFWIVFLVFSFLLWIMDWNLAIFYFSFRIVLWLGF